MSMMLEEIRQQPAVLERILASPPDALARLGRRFSRSRPDFAVIVARGTSDHAAIFGRYLFEITLGLPTLLAAPSVATLYRRLSLPPGALVIGISQSGESTDINGYVRAAKSLGAFCIGITNEADSTLAGLADEVLATGAGKEQSVAATKTYTAQLAMLYWLARALGAEIGADDLKKIPGAVAAQLEGEQSVHRLADSFRDMSHAVVIGRGFNQANGFEFALKLMETCYVVATGFSGADFAHGPIAIVEERFPVFAFSPVGPTLEQTEALLSRLQASQAETVCFGPSATVRALPSAQRIEVAEIPPSSPELPLDVLSVIPMIIPAQLFAGHLSAGKGLNPDHPRMLSKVTQTL